MTHDRVLAWAIAELSASAAVRAALGSPALVGNQDRDDGSAPGLFVWVPESAGRERFADDCPLRVRGYVRGSRAAAVAAQDAAHGAFRFHAGCPKAWGVPPGDHGLRLRGIRLDAATMPERDGAAADGFAFTLAYTVTGKDADESA